MVLLPLLVWFTMLDKKACLVVFISKCPYLCCIVRVGVKRSLSQFIPKFAMEISIREWSRDDLSQIQRVWLDYCQSLARSDMRLSRDANSAMKQWLTGRFRQPRNLGFVAEADRVI